MRKIGAFETILFFSMQSVVYFLLGLISYLLLQLPVSQAIIAMLILFSLIIFYFLINAFIYRTFMYLFPLRTGPIALNSPHEKIYHLHVAFYLMCFYPYLRSHLVPTPFSRLMNMALGSKIGENTYPSGFITDSIFVSIGDYCVIGADSKIIPHALEGLEVAHYPVQIGNRVTLGVNSVIFAGSSIGDDAIVAAGSIVKKHSVIGSGEIWAGIPAKKIGDRSMSQTRDVQ